MTRKSIKFSLVTLSLLAALALALTGCGKKPVAAQPDPFRDQLAADGPAVIDINETVTLTGDTYVVKGEKLLTGTGVLDAKGVTGDFVLTVAEGATLKLDGVIVDGGGKAKGGIMVSANAQADLAAGEVKAMTRLGMRVDGKAVVAGSITDTVGWLDVREGGEVAVSGAILTSSSGVGIQTAKGSTLTVTDAVLNTSRSNIIYNNGTATVENTSMADCGMFLLANNGTMVVKGSDMSEADGQGMVQNYEGADLTVTDTKMAGSKDLMINNSGTAKFERVTMTDGKGYAVYNVGEGATFTAVDTSVSNNEATAFFNRAGSVMNLTNVKVDNVKGYGVFNRAGTLTADGVTSTRARGLIAVNESATDNDSIYGTMKLSNLNVDSAPTYGLINYGGQLVLTDSSFKNTGSSAVYVRGGKATMTNVNITGVKGSKEALPGVQVGHVDVPDAVVTMTNVNISGGWRGITNRGTLTFNSGTISNNHNGGQLKSGGGINNYKTLIINGGTITGNSAVENGGGVFNQGTLTINGGVISGNKSGSSGAGIGNAKAGTLTINKGEIINNATEKNGGGIYNGGTLTLVGGTIKGNTNGKEGTGAGVVNDGVLNMRGGTITANNSTTSAGGLQNTSNGTAVLSGGTISANTTSNGKGGGGIYNTGKLTLQGNIQVTGNKSAGGGAAINNAKSTSGSVGTVTITGGTFSGNVAGTSGGVIANSAKLTLTGGTLTGNKATNNGGAVYNTGDMVLGGAAFKGNTAGKNAPDVFNDGGKLTLTGTVKAGLWSNAVVEYNDAFSTSSAVTLSRFGDLKGRQNVARAAAGSKSRDVSAAFITADGSKVNTEGVVNTAVEAKLLSANGSQKATGTLMDMMSKAANTDVVEVIADATVDGRITLSEKAVTLRDDGKAHTITVTAPNRAFQLNKGSNLRVVGKGGLTFKGSTSGSSAICVNENSTLDMQGKITVTGFNGTCETDKSGGAFIWNTSTGTTVLNGVTFKGNQSAKNGSVLFSGGGSVTLTNITTSGNSAGSGQDFYITSDTKVAIYGGTYTSGTAHGGQASIFVNENCALTLGGKPTMDITAYKLVTKLDKSFDPKSDVTLYLDSYTKGKTVLTGDADVIKAAVEAGAFDLPRAATQTTPKALDIDGKLVNAGSGSAPVVSSGDPEVRLLDAAGKEKGVGSLVAMAAQAGNGDILELFTDVTLGQRVTFADKTVTLRDDGTPRTITVTAQNRAFQLNQGATFRVEGKGGLTFKGTASPASAIIVNENSTLSMSGKITVTGFDGSCETDKSGGSFIWNTTSGVTILDGVTFKDNKTAKYGSAVFSGGGTLTLKNVAASGGKASSGQDIYATGETKVTIDGGKFSSGTSYGGQASIFVNEKCSLTLKGAPKMDITAYKLVTKLDNSFVADQASITLYLDGYAAGKKVLSGSDEVLTAAADKGSFLLPRALEQKTPTALTGEGTLGNADGSEAVLKPSNEPAANLYASNGTLRASGSFAAMVAQAQDGDVLELFADVTMVERVTLSGKSLTIRDDGTPRTIKVSSPNRAFQITKGGSLTVTGVAGLTFKGGSASTVAICVNNGSLNMSGKITVTGFNCSNATDTNGGAFIWNTASGTTVLNGVTFTDNKSAVAGPAVYAAGGTVKLTNVTASGGSAGSGQEVCASGDTRLTVENCSITGGKGRGGKAALFVGGYASVTLAGKNTLDMTADGSVVELADSFDPATQVTLYLNAYSAGKRVLNGAAAVLQAVADAKTFQLPGATEPCTILANGTLSLG